MRPEIAARIAQIRRGEVPDGYKRTKAGIVPAHWKEISVGEMGTFYGGLSGKTKDDFGIGDAVYIPFKNVLENVVIDIRQLPRVRVGDDEKQNAVKQYDLFFNLSSETIEEVGMCAVLMENLSGAYLNSFCVGFRLCQDFISPLWLAHYFNSACGRNVIFPLAQGVTRINLNRAGFEKTAIQIPPLDEQRAIADVLSAQDKMIALKERLIAEKTRQKRYLTQQYLTGKRRLPGFDGEWKTEKLGDVCILNPGRGAAVPAEVTFLGMADVTEDGRITNQRVVPYDTVKNGYTPFARGDILLAKITPCFENGKGAYTDSLLTRFGFGSTEFHVLRANSKIWGQYLFSHTQSPVFRKKLESEMTGTAGQKRVQTSSVASYEIPCPPIEEQRAIAEILSAADREIELLRRSLELERRKKTALTQLLLTGLARLS